MLSCLGTATDLLDVPKQPTCMNASHCPEREIIGHVTFQRPHAWLFSVPGKKQVVSLVIFVGISRCLSAEPSPGCLLGCTMCELPGGVAGDENSIYTHTHTHTHHTHTSTDHGLGGRIPVLILMRPALQLCLKISLSHTPNTNTCTVQCISLSHKHTQY